MQNETLLIKFIESKMTSYRNMGNLTFPEKRYRAALCMLAGRSMKTRAEKFRLSYNSLRRWAIDKAFIGLAKNLTDEFAEILISHVRKKAVGCDYKAFGMLDWSEILDANEFSTPLKRRLKVLFYEELRTFRDSRFIFVISQILNLTESIPDELFERLTKDVGLTNRAILRLLCLGAKSVTYKYWLMRRDRVFIRRILDIFQRAIQ